MSRSSLAFTLLLTAAVGAAMPAWAAVPAPATVAQAADTEPVEALLAQALKLLEAHEDDAAKKAVPLLVRAAQRGHVPAQIQLGALCGEPSNGVYDRAGAIAWLRRAGEKGGADAWFWLAHTLAFGANKQDAQEAIALWTRAAEAGHPAAMGRLAAMSANDWPAPAGLPADQARATKWFGVLAEKGDGDAQEEYAARLQTGRGTAADPVAAARWYEKAAAQQRDSACIALATLWLDPPPGLKRAPEAAVRWLRAAAERRDEEAWFLLAELAEKGDGLRQDLAEARRCYRKSLDEGNMVASEPLGRLFEKGLGGPADAFEACKWYSLSVTAEARQAAERLAKTLTPDQRKALAKAVEDYRTWQADQP